MSQKAVFEPLKFERFSQDEQLQRSRAFHDRMLTRRTVREFSPEPVPFELIKNAIGVAASAPSGANQQPWTFVAVSDREIKRRMRIAAEAEERENYRRRMSDDWLAALAHLGTDWRKPHIEVAPYVIVVFRQAYGFAVDERTGEEARVKHYYSEESVGIAVGFLLAALHMAGLATLTHTPSPMKFLREILDRPGNERPYVLIPVGYPHPSAQTPRIEKKSLADVLIQF